MGAIVYAAFFIALIAMPIYGGRAYDENGYQPFKAPVPIICKKWDANITAFSVQLLILVAGIAAVSAEGLVLNEVQQEAQPSGAPQSPSRV